MDKHLVGDIIEVNNETYYIIEEDGKILLKKYKTPEKVLEDRLGWCELRIKRLEEIIDNKILIENSNNTSIE